MNSSNKFKSLFTYLLLSGLLASHPVFADWLGTLKSATEVIKQTGVLDKLSEPANKPAEAAGGVLEKIQAGSVNQIASQTDLPLGLTEYPRSVLHQRIDNPFDQLMIPISPPKRITSDKWVPRYSVPVEGQVTMLQFTHEANDSPLLIQKHYESWLAGQGFERLLVCQAPCKQADVVYWLPYIDQARRMEWHMFPKDATYIAAYKDNAMALVSVGQLGNKTHGSFVKVVEGRVTDNSQWKMLTTQVAPLPEVASSQAAVNNGSANTRTAQRPAYVNKPLPEPMKVNERALIEVPKDGKAPVGIQDVAFDQSMAQALHQQTNISTPGLGALFITKEGQCEACTKQSQLFERSAKKYAGKVSFLRTTAPAEPRVVFGDVVQYVAFPSMVLYKDGKYINNPYWANNDGDLDDVIKADALNIEEGNAEAIRWNTAIKLREKRGIPVREVPVKPVSVSLPKTTTAPSKMLFSSLNANSTNQLLHLAEGSEGILVVHASSNHAGCSWCIKSNPVFETLAKKYAGRATFMMATAAGNWTESFASDFAIAYGLYAVPTTFVFKDGQLIKRLDGYKRLEDMEDALMH
ncbi:co-chaperone YbbN [Methylophilus sp. 5]|uniref:thioredoxin family protein n=1 Tax=Methylophilus sp. 5 TaxID=1112274 RepID=UPI0004903D4E|nr:thioredoxin family protein [Methylophilus sp. 5]